MYRYILSIHLHIKIKIDTTINIFYLKNKMKTIHKVFENFLSNEGISDDVTWLEITCKQVISPHKQKIIECQLYNKKTHLLNEKRLS